MISEPRIYIKENMIKQIGTTNFLIHNIKIIMKSQLKKGLGIFLVIWVTQWKVGAESARQFYFM